MPWGPLSEEKVVVVTVEFRSRVFFQSAPTFAAQSIRDSIDPFESEHRECSCWPTRRAGRRSQVRFLFLLFDLLGVQKGGQYQKDDQKAENFAPTQNFSPERTQVFSIERHLGQNKQGQKRSAQSQLSRQSKSSSITRYGLVCGGGRGCPRNASPSSKTRQRRRKKDQTSDRSEESEERSSSMILGEIPGSS